MNISIYKEHFSKVLKIFGKSNSYISVLFLFFLVSAALDLVGIALIGPFVLIFFDFDKIQQDYGLFTSFDQTTLAIYASILIISIFLIRSICIYFINAFILNVSFDRQVELRGQLIAELLEQDYSDRLEKSTAYYTRSIFAFCQQFVQSTINIFRIAAESISVFCIIILLLITDSSLFITALIFSIASLGAMFYIFSRKFIRYGTIKNEGLLNFTNGVHEAVDGIKSIKVYGLSKFFQNKVTSGASLAASAEKKLYLYSIVPRYFVETVLVGIICLILSVSIYLYDDVVSIVPTLSIFLVASLRLLPSISLIISAFNGINLDIDAISKLYEDFNFEENIDSQKNKTFTKSTDSSEIKNIFENFKSIKFKDIHFQYNADEPVLEGLNLSVETGDFIGLVGKSGEGKTTLIDLILGINVPDKGDITIDGHSVYENLEFWRSRIAYLPQEIFLINGSVAENIALGEEAHEIDYKLVEACIEKAGLKDVIDAQPDGITTQIGEKGLKFSGGQRQRIALARAFYSGRSFFLLDESTSALDHAAAERILEQISELAKAGSTVILISHNEEMLSRCNRKLRISNGEIYEI